VGGPPKEKGRNKKILGNTRNPPRFCPLFLIKNFHACAPSRGGEKKKKGGSAEGKRENRGKKGASASSPPRNLPFFFPMITRNLLQGPKRAKERGGKRRGKRKHPEARPSFVYSSASASFDVAGKEGNATGEEGGRGDKKKSTPGDVAVIIAQVLHIAMKRNGNAKEDREKEKKKEKKRVPSPFCCRKKFLLFASGE